MSGPKFEGMIVHNDSNEIILCSVTNKTGGNPAPVEIKPFESREYRRTSWEDVVIVDKQKTRERSLWINRGGPAIVRWKGFVGEVEECFVIFNDFRPEAGFIMNNLSPRTIMAFVSSNTNNVGRSALVSISPGKNAFWPRNGWEAIGIKTQDGDDNPQRRGFFMENNGRRDTVDFLGWDEELVVHKAPANFILDEHVAEAHRISDRSFAAGDSRASNPGGLTASIYKIDELEMACTGKKSSLGDHVKIYKLGMLINHLRYGLAEPAVVVSITPEWVKVAAYTCEFDAIVLLGFPTKAIDLVAPNKTRPTVGTRLLVVNQFSYRSPNNPGVQADITMGPRTYDKWANFHPLIAQFVSDDSQSPIWEQQLEKVEEHLWGEIWTCWLDWKEKHGENYFRLGAPSKIKDLATNHTDHGLPAYAP